MSQYETDLAKYRELLEKKDEEVLTELKGFEVKDFLRWETTIIQPITKQLEGTVDTLVMTYTLGAAALTLIFPFGVAFAGAGAALAGRIAAGIHKSKHEHFVKLFRQSQPRD